MLLSIFSPNPSLIIIPSSLQTLTSGILAAKRSPHLPKIIWASVPYSFCILSTIAWILAHTDGSVSTASITRSTIFIADTTFILYSWSWNNSVVLVLSLACRSLLTITRNSSHNFLHSSKHSICPGWIGLKYHDVITIVFFILRYCLVLKCCISFHKTTKLL